MTPTRTYRGASGAERREQRRQALLAAALDLAVREGSTAVTVRRACAEAGLNQRYLYESFPGGPDELLVAAFDAARLRVAHAMREAIAQAAPDPGRQARAVADAVVALVADPPHYGRMLLFEGRVAGALHPHRERMLMAAAEQFADEVAARLGPSAPPRQETAVAGLMLAGAVHELLLAWQSGDLEMTRGAVAERIARAIVSALD